MGSGSGILIGFGSGDGSGIFGGSGSCEYIGCIKIIMKKRLVRTKELHFIFLSSITIEDIFSYMNMIAISKI